MVSARLSLRAALAAMLVGALCAVPAWAQDQGDAAPASGGFVVPERPVWAGEVFDLTLVWRLDWDRFRSFEGPLEWSPERVAAEPWSEPELVAPQPGESDAEVTLRTRAIAVVAGPTPLPPARQMMAMQTGASPLDRPAVTEASMFDSAPSVVDVRPLPLSPPEFSNAVGSFALVSTVEPRSVAVGDRVVWTLTLEGVGNWPYLDGLPSRRAPEGFDVAAPPAQSEDARGGVFERALSEQVTLTAREAGEHGFGPVELVVFDPAAGDYVTLTAPEVVVSVDEGDGIAAVSPEPPTRAGPVGEDEIAAGDDALPPPLAGSGSAWRPMSERAWRLSIMAPAFAVAAFWLLLALRRAWMTDEERSARRADARLGRLLQRLRETPDPRLRRPLVRDWLEQTAARLKMDHAAPTPASFADRQAWMALWRDAEGCVYGRDGSLPDDWIERAHDAWKGLERPRRFAPATVLAPRNLYPWATAAAFVLVCWAGPSMSRAQEGAGEGGGAHALRAEVAAAPLDWKARHNLALALAEEGDWTEAAGHAAVAWMQHPGSRATHALWRRAASEAGHARAPGGGLLDAVMGIASASAWRYIAAGLAGLAAVSALAALMMGYGAMAHGAAAYGRARPGANRAALAVLSASLLGAAGSWAMATAYGPASFRDGALVMRSSVLRPLPVETLADEHDVLLTAGAAGRVDARFLDWRRLRLSDGRVGWLRGEDLLWIWGDPQAE